MRACTICNNREGNSLFTAKEMMFWFRDEFEYLECGNCGCLELTEVPEDLSRYYPNEYYSLNSSQESLFKRLLKRQRGRYAIGASNVGGKFLVKKWGVPQIVQWIQGLNLTFDSKILDIGSGNGTHLHELSNIGFKNLTGIDPFVEHDIEISSNFRILKKELSSLRGNFDFIMCNHSLEHTPDQFDTLQNIHRLLKADGTALIRIPLAGTYAWKEYGTHWVQLDAPRHLFLHTKKSFRILAEKTGFSIDRTVFDSTEFQFTGSERYKQGIALTDENSFELFDQNTIIEFRQKAETLNEQEEGDQACFYISKT